MTEWAIGHTCEDCDQYDETCCRNTNSDHYCHTLMALHPVCEHAVIVKEAEYVHHVHCAIHEGGECDCNV